MKGGVLGKKLGMTQIFGEKGERIPVTALKVGPCKVVGKRTKARDGYSAVCIAFEEANAFRVNKPNIGRFKKANLPPMKFVSEIPVPEDKLDGFEIGSDYPLGDFAEGDYVDIQGKSKGKGTQGVMRRHNFRGFRKTHGTHEYTRHAGSIGQKEFPGRVWKGKRMEGHMGDEKVTVQNLTIAKIDAENGIFLVKGSVPGAKNGLVRITKAVKKTNNKK
ncbi:MAG: 50S ribosomal protein L3 [Myxococcota bacterium]